MPMLRVSTMPIIANFRKAMVAVDRLYPTRSAMLVNTTGPPLGYNLASAATISRSLYDRFLSINCITFIVKAPLLSMLLDYLRGLGRVYHVRRPYPNPFAPPDTTATTVHPTAGHFRTPCPTVEAVGVALVEVCILVADGRLERQVGKDELAPQSYGDSAQPRALGA